jgi:hypothetical protein
MEQALNGASVGGDIKHTSELKVLNYKKGIRRFEMRRHDSISITCLLSS